ncbi:MAG: hypothetical protein GZ087_08375 [Flavobacterium sp.]|nr:hypothetical protein [Flavobacterium sp.]
MKNSILTLFLFCSSFIYSQINFEKGYFISNSGVQTECFIKNYDWKSNPIEFEYKITLQKATSRKETVANIKEFGIENSSKFKRFKVNMERSLNFSQNLSSNRNPVWIEEILFLKVLIEGDAKLYSYIDENMYKYFYETKSKPIAQLVRIKYATNNTENSNGIDSFSESIMENNLFRQQLNSDLTCESITENDFQNLKYDL